VGVQCSLAPLAHWCTQGLHLSRTCRTGVGVNGACVCVRVCVHAPPGVRSAYDSMRPPIVMGYCEQGTSSLPPWWWDGPSATPSSSSLSARQVSLTNSAFHSANRCLSSRMVVFTRQNLARREQARIEVRKQQKAAQKSPWHGWWSLARNVEPLPKAKLVSPTPPPSFLPGPPSPTRPPTSRVHRDTLRLSDANGATSKHRKSVATQECKKRTGTLT
jgi:hypothetical protein